MKGRAGGLVSPPTPPPIAEGRCKDAAAATIGRGHDTLGPQYLDGHNLLPHFFFFYATLPLILSEGDHIPGMVYTFEEMFTVLLQIFRYCFHMSLLPLLL